MNNNHKKIEVLAPCGSYDILIAAIHAGADACYIGGNCFGARAYAENFDQETIVKAVSYAHLHGVKVYLTVNTLLKQNELSELYDYIKPFYESGGDALIIQDLGVFSYVRAQFPDIAIHCSTQMNITSRYGAKLMKEQGASRVVTAREMSLAEIHDIKEHVDIEVETFVHGAMCYSYSGQCLMSSLAGGRSGNRGRCAQPCRKCYNNSYLLSMKDMCALFYIPELIEAGIDSLKIEGRMKNAYYVASTVHAYRTMVDDYQKGHFNKKKAESLAFELANIYNRGGFSDGYFFRHNGPEMISFARPNNQGVAIGTLEQIGKGTVTMRLQEDVYPQDVLELATIDDDFVEITASKVGKAGQSLTLNCPKTRQLKKAQILYRTKCPHILNHVQEDYIDKFAKIPITFTLNAHIGMPISVTVKRELSGTNYEATLTSQIVEPSQKQNASYDMIKKPFSQLGNTEYTLNDFVCDIDRNVFLPNSVLKNMRRDVLEKLEDNILTAQRREASGKLAWDAIYDTRNVEKNAYIPTTEHITDHIISVSDFSQFLAVKKMLLQTKLKVDVITVPDTIYADCIKQAPASIAIYIELPHVIHSDYALHLQETQIRGIYIRNIDELAILNDLELPSGCRILCDAGLYCYNRLAHAFIKGLLSSRVAFITPRELKLDELATLAKEPLCLMLYEYQPVMISANCVKKSKQHCTKKDGLLSITDERGNTFYARTYCKYCYNVIYNKVPYSILDKYKEPDFSDLHSAGYMMRFTIETEDQTVQILRILTGEDSRLKEKTGGHLYRGVL